MTNAATQCFGFLRPEPTIPSPVEPPTTSGVPIWFINTPPKTHTQERWLARYVRTRQNFQTSTKSLGSSLYFRIFQSERKVRLSSLEYCSRDPQMHPRVHCPQPMPPQMKMQGLVPMNWGPPPGPPPPYLGLGLAPGEPMPGRNQAGPSMVQRDRKPLEHLQSRSHEVRSRIQARARRATVPGWMYRLFRGVGRRVGP